MVQILSAVYMGKTFLYAHPRGAFDITEDQTVQMVTDSRGDYYMKGNIIYFGTGDTYIIIDAVVS
jgi:hypothetical protein